MGFHRDFGTFQGVWRCLWTHKPQYRKSNDTGRKMSRAAEWCKERTRLISVNHLHIWIFLCDRTCWDCTFAEIGCGWNFFVSTYIAVILKRWSERRYQINVSFADARCRTHSYVKTLLTRQSHNYKIQYNLAVRLYLDRELSHNLKNFTF